MSWEAKGLGLFLVVACGAGCGAEETARGFGTEHHAGAATEGVPELRTGKVATAAGTREIEYEVIDGVAVVGGDMLVPWSDFVDARVPYAAAIVRDETWPGGVIPYEIDPALPSPSRVPSAIAHWHSRTPVRLVPRTTEADYVRFVNGSGCSSYVGRIGGPQPVSLNAACSVGNAIHEIGHAVGLWHEQSRLDRDEHVIIHWENIQPGREFNFETYDLGLDVSIYDVDSIMHYGSYSFSVNGQPTITRLDGGLIAGQRTALTQADLAAVEYFYGRRFHHSGNNFLPCDVNTDGRRDMVIRYPDGVMEVRLSDGVQLLTNNTFATSFSDAEGWYGGNRFISLDLNADGTEELLVRYPDGRMEVYRWSGTVLVLGGVITTKFRDDSGWSEGNRFLAMDVNGDRRDDLVVRFPDGRMDVHRSTGTNLVYSHSFPTSFGDEAGWNAGNRFLAMDMNGDFLDDLVARYPDGRMDVHISNGTSLSYSHGFATSFGDAGGWNAGSRFYPMDMDGDLRDDLVIRRPEGTMEVHRSDGVSFQYSHRFPTRFADVIQ